MAGQGADEDEAMAAAAAAAAAAAHQQPSTAGGGGLLGLRGWRSKSQVAPLGGETMRIKTKGRRLDVSGAASYAFLAALVLWFALEVVAFGVGYHELQLVPPPVADMQAGALVSALATRVRYYATELVVGAAAGAPAATLAPLQAQLAGTADELLFQYDQLLFGNASMGLSGSLYRSTARDSLLFGTGCLRAAASGPCYTPDSPFYPHTNYGLDALLKYYVQQAQLLAADNPVTLNLADTRYTFIWEARHARARGTRACGARARAAAPARERRSVPLICMTDSPPARRSFTATPALRRLRGRCCRSSFCQCSPRASLCSSSASSVLG